MALTLYNTLSRQKEVFKPINEGIINFYLCGPTVYNYIHIGNARSAVAFDTIRRYLEMKGYQVNYVSNFTDVDDKIIKAAKEENLTAKEIADKYIKAYKEDTAAINVRAADNHPRVMENIPEIIDYIKVLIEKGYAYVSQGDVYYRTAEFENYGALSDQTIGELRAGASDRVKEKEAELKENPLDFALWKNTKSPDEISWDSPWGQGRPGWHIECSVMATKYLGPQLDIHAGGQDLQFPHHENEIAQSEAHSDLHPFSNYWLHNGFVTIGQEDEKMSKSLGNFVLLRELLKETDPMVIRYLLSTTHYRRPLRYDHNSLKDASNNVARLQEVIRRIDYRMEHPGQGEEADGQGYWQEIADQEENYMAAMDDDFNAANAISAVFEIIKNINLYLEADKIDTHLLSDMRELLEKLLAVFGLEFTQQEVIEEDIEALIEERNQARKDKNFARADEIRDQLKEEGILLDDTPQGTQWKREN